MARKRVSWDFPSIPCLQIALTAAKGSPLPMFENPSLKCLYYCLFSFTMANVKSQNIICLFIQNNSHLYSIIFCDIFVKLLFFLFFWQVWLVFGCFVLFEIARKPFPILFLPLLFASSQLFAPAKFILNWGGCSWYQKLIKLKRNQTSGLFWGETI